MLNEKDYITVSGWMVTELELSGSDLIAYAVVYAYSQTGAGVYHGGPAYLAKWTGWTSKTAGAYLRSLCKRGYLLREAVKDSRGYHFTYRANPAMLGEGREESSQGGREKTSQGVGKKLPNPPKEYNSLLLENKKGGVNARARDDSPASLTLPFNDERFAEVWADLCSQPKWRKKTRHALELSLRRLARYDVDYAIDLMERAIEGGYQGVVFDDTDERYAKWLAQREASAKEERVYTPEEYYEMIRNGKR